MNNLREESGSMGRWYIALPPLLLVGFLSSLFFLAAAGQSRLNAADERVHTSEARRQALDDFLALIIDAESEQRGYLLTGKDADLRSYASAAAKIEPALVVLSAAYRSGTAPPTEIGQLRSLSQRKLAELDHALAAHTMIPAGSAADAGQLALGSPTTDTIRQRIALLLREEDAELAAATARSQSDLRLSRWVTTCGALLNIGLVLLATGLVYGDMRRRARQA